jgi:transcriptional regulator with XRE-family HTH domain
MSRKPLNERLAKARGGLDIGQAEMAKRLGVTQSAISQWERGEVVPSVGHVAAVAAAYGIRITLDDLTEAKAAKAERAA